MTAKTTLANWKANKRHTITLPSGTEVQIEIPNLPKMIKGGDVPNHLLQAAIQAQSGNIQITEELIKDQWEFYRFLVQQTVKEPEIALADTDEIPYEDVEMLVEIATRNRDVDVLGHHLAGLEKQADFRKFRNLDRPSEAFAGV